MASSIIHLAVGNEINKKLKRDKASILIGSIAPDISKQVGETKLKSHFLRDEFNQIPNIDAFLEKYKSNLDDDFVLGYYIHLLTDYLWFKYFMTEISRYNLIKTLDGREIRCTSLEFQNYIYNDYTNMNILLIDYYNLDLKIFYNELPKFNNIIEEIPMDKLSVIVDSTGIIIENSKRNKDLAFTIDNIVKFISTSTELILANLESLGIK